MPPRRAVATPACVGALSSLRRAVAARGVLRSRHAAVALCCLWVPLPAAPPCGLPPFLPVPCPRQQMSRPGVAARGESGNAGVADQVATASLFQRLAYQLVVLGLAILDERALHGLLGAARAPHRSVSWCAGPRRCSTCTSTWWTGWGRSPAPVRACSPCRAASARSTASFMVEPGWLEIRYGTTYCLSPYSRFKRSNLRQNAS